MLRFRKLTYSFAKDIVNYREVLAAPNQKVIEAYETMS